MNNRNLLPPNQTALEKRLSFELSQIFNLGVPISLLWHAEHCPTHLLSWLAWTLSVDEWDDNWSEEQKRNTILQSARLHKQKGTVASIRRVLQSAGYGDAEIVENLSKYRHNGEIKRDGSRFHGGDNTTWAMYRIYLKRPISIEQAEQVKRLLNNTAPARCHLVGLHFAQAQHLHNGKILRNGTYTHGVA